jgi:hypothetical protein
VQLANGIHRVIVAGESLDLKPDVCLVTNVDSAGFTEVGQDAVNYPGAFLIRLKANNYTALDHSFLFVICRMSGRPTPWRARAGGSRGSRSRSSRD